MNKLNERGNMVIAMALACMIGVIILVVAYQMKMGTGLDVTDSIISVAKAVTSLNGQSCDVITYANGVVETVCQ